MKNGNIFTIAASNEQTTTELFTELGTLLGVAKRSDGKYHLADLCQAGSINRWSKNKPFRHSSENFDYNPAEDKVTKAAVAKSTDIQGNKTTLRATLKGSASFNASALTQVDISARAYIKLSDGTIEYVEILYSNNDKDGTYIDNGYATKSIIGVAKTMAGYIVGQTEMKVTYTEAVADEAAVPSYSTVVYPKDTSNATAPAAVIVNLPTTFVTS